MKRFCIYFTALVIFLVGGAAIFSSSERYSVQRESGKSKSPSNWIAPESSAETYKGILFGSSEISWGNQFDLNSIIDAKRNVLEADNSSEQRVSAINFLGDLARAGVSTNRLEEIRGILREAVLSGRTSWEKKAALFTYTRSFRRVDSNFEVSKMLEESFNVGVISEVEYAGELIHMAMLFDEKTLLKKGLNMNKDDDHAKIVLYNYLSSISNEDDFNRSVLDAELLKYIKENPVKFTGAPFAFSLMEAVQYNDWTESIAVMEERLNGISHLQVLSAPFADPFVDPRVLIALVLSPKKGTKIIEFISSDDIYTNGVTKMRKFLSDYENIPAIKILANDINHKIQSFPD